MKKINNKAFKIKLLALDVDGVLSDGRIILGNNGEEFKFFDVHDGLGILLALKTLIIAIITKRKSKLVEIRAEELGITELYQGIDNKLEVFNQLREEYGLKWEETAFVGDDIIDVPILKKCGLACTVADGIDQVKEVVDYVAQKKGGRGAVREIIDLIFESKGLKLEDYLS